ncbi:hypothetical protein HDU85_001347 [Gaertneriomyces sp. JEL0708]|nr:hypothetical protein HDU85_001347 [Gaertneriomyces sp. JEL0708]
MSVDSRRPFGAANVLSSSVKSSICSSKFHFKEQDMPSVAVRELVNSLYTQGFLNGLFSDVKLNILGMTFNLHRIVLMHNEYFASMLSGGPWKETKNAEIDIEVDDPNITVEAVTIVLARLYGKPEIPMPNGASAMALLAAASFFGDAPLADRATEFIALDISVATVIDYLTFSDRFYYGKCSELILELCVNYLCREGVRSVQDTSDDDEAKIEGRKAMLAVYTKLPREWLRRVLTSECLWAENEQDRLSFVLHVIKARWEMSHCEKSASNTADDMMADEESPIAVAAESRDIEEMHMATEDHSVPQSDVHSFHSESTQKGADSCSVDPVPHRLFQSSLHKDEHEEERRFYHELLRDSILFTSLPFTTLQELFQRLPQHAATGVPVTLLTDALWAQREFQHIITSASPLTLELKPDSADSIVPGTDTNMIDGIKLIDVILAEERKRSPADSTASVDHPVQSISMPVLPPIRFSVEFPPIRTLLFGDKAYSKPVFYGGSMWHLYLHPVKDERESVPKLGVYVQRIPVPTPVHRIVYTPLPAETPYIDNRLKTITWFKVYCFFGPKAYILESKPDEFALRNGKGQSWGYRIGTLYRDAMEWGGKLRCSVVLGHV